jgi:glutathione S-transferase
MYQVIGPAMSRTFRVIWAMEEMGLDYEHVATGFRSAKLQAANPSAKAPVLGVDGQFISDSSAILQFLADRHDQLTYPAGTLDRAQQDSFLHFINDEVDGVLWTLSKHSYALPKELHVADIRPALDWEYARSMDILETRLGDKDYVMGDTFTVPDIILGHCLMWGISAKMPMPQPSLRAYVDRITARPAYLRAHAIRKSG